MKKIALIAVLLPIAALFACTADRDNPYDPKSSSYLLEVVTFDSRGGSAVSPQDVGYNDRLDNPGTPVRTGYAFNGWFHDTACTQQWDFASDTVTADTTLYAGWTPIQYDIVFDSQGGSAVDAQAVNYDDYVTEPGEPVRTGNAFTGWFREPGCFNEWRFAIDTVTGDATLFAGWTLNQYTLTYTAGAGGSISGASPQTVSHGGSSTAVTAVPGTGYHFSQWSDGSSANPRTDTNVTAGISVIAQFAINQYTVSFNSQGGSAVGAQTVDHGDLVAEPSDPVRTGYTFGGWYHEAGCVTSWIFMLDAVTGATTLFAGWIPIAQTVTFDSQGGSAVNPQTVNYDSLVSEPSAPARTGYTFAGWYREAGCVTAWVFAGDRVTGDTTLYAKWTVNQYTVTYVGNGNSGGSVPAGNPFTYYYGDTVTVYANTGSLVKTGYTFTGWNTAENGTGTHYNPGDTFPMTASNMTLYAHWTNLDMTFDPGTGANDYIFKVAVQADDKIVIGGRFDSYNGTGRNCIARLNTNGSLDTTFDVGSGANSNVTALAIESSGRIVIVGFFYLYRGVVRNHIARINTDGTDDASFNVGSGPDASGYTPYLTDIAIDSSERIIVSGHFNGFSGTGVNNVARLNSNGSVDTTFAGNSDGAVQSLGIQDDDKVLIGGEFNTTSYGGVTRNRIARISENGSLDLAFDPGSGFDWWVGAIAVQDDGKILIGGAFSTYNGVIVNNIVRVNSDGSIDSTFNSGSGADYQVEAIVIQDDGKILIGGAFNQYNGTSVKRFARLNADGTLDTSLYTGSGVNGEVYSIAIQGDGKIVIAGSFTSYNGTTRNRIARISP